MKTNKKAFGFFATLVSAVLAVVSAICYGVYFKGIEYKEPVFNIQICIILAVIGVVAVALLLINERTAGFAPALLCLGSGISFLMFVQMVIWPIADTIYGIEPFAEFNKLVLCAVLMLVTLVTAEVGLYTRKYRNI